jgi:hypothetical protein
MCLSTERPPTPESNTPIALAFCTAPNYPRTRSATLVRRSQSRQLDACGPRVTRRVSRSRNSDARRASSVVILHLRLSAGTAAVRSAGRAALRPRRNVHARVGAAGDWLVAWRHRRRADGERGEMRAAHSERGHSRPPSRLFLNSRMKLKKHRRFVQILQRRLHHRAGCCDRSNETYIWRWSGR